MRAFVGTSGWRYTDWRGLVYPDGVPPRRWLEYYATLFGTVEVNSAFYRLPERSVFEQWRDRTPEGFVVAVKVSRYLTHVKRLREPAEPVARFLDRAAGLGPKLGPVLLQLPPTLSADPGLLDATLARFPPEVRVAVEPRHPSWFTGEVRAVLEARRAALCWADRLGRPVTPRWRTADFGYLRLHEGRASPRPSYGPAALRSWAARLRASYEGDVYGGDVYEGDVFVYFNNDRGAAAVRNARTMVEDLAHGDF